MIGFALVADLSVDAVRSAVGSLADGIDTTLRFELSPERRRLTLTHAGFRGVGPRLVGMILSRGWARMLAGSLAREVQGAGASP